MARRSISVLVVDDQSSFRRAAADVIAVTAGFVLAGEASSGDEAIRFMERRGAELVLMDVNMPGMDGVEATRTIRRRFPDVAIVLLSVVEELRMRADAASCGAQFCHKDRFGPDELEALWRQAGSEPA